jgi:hypothetical protein
MTAMQSVQANQVDVPLNVGTLPNFNTRLGNPQLINMYSNNNALYCTPGLHRLAEQENIRALHYSAYNNGFYVAVTNNNVYRVGLNGTSTLLSTISFTGFAVKIDENSQNQITITDGGGSYAYVYSPRVNTFLKIAAEQGIDTTRLQTIVGVVVINTFTILLSAEGFFQISTPNNALLYSEAYIAQMDPALTQGAALASLDNNLYIFGTTGIERWEPGLTNDYGFPFTRDSNYRTDYGTVSAASVVRAIDEVYFLSTYFVPMVLTGNGARELIKDTQYDEQGRSQKSSGIARIIGSYADKDKAYGSFYTNRGNYFYQLTFLTEQIGWVTNVKNKIWAYSDDLITAAPQKEIKEVVGTVTGIYQLTDTPLPGIPKHRLFIPQRLPVYKGTQPYRATVNGFEARIVQGELQTTDSYETYVNPDNQQLQLSVSIDGLTYGNIVSSPIGKTGERQSVTTWKTNITCQEVTPKLEYWGDLDLCIEKFYMYVK